VPAVSAAVVIGQAVVWRRGHGSIDLAQRVPAAPDSIYSICSISKLLTAVAMMQLWEQGKLSLDDDVARWVPDFAIRRHDVDSGPITLRALLSHSAGLPREADAPYWNAPAYAFPDRGTLYQRLREQTTVDRVGNRFQYSNLGMAVLGDVVAAVSGQPYEDYVQQQVLAPLKMADTRPRLPVGDARLATGFGARQRDAGRSPLPPFDARALAAAAGYSSTVDDLAQFARWQFRLLKDGGRELLKVSTLREMQRVQWTDPDGKNTWGLGFAVSRDGAHTVVSHAGWCPGYRSAIALMPQQQLAVVSMVNSGDAAGVAPYARQIRQLMVKGLTLPVAVPGPDKPVLADYAGRYASQPWSSELVVLPWGEQLAMLGLPSTDPAGEMELLKPSGRDRFRFVRADGSLGAELVFERDAQGVVSGYRQWSQRSARLSPLPP
jgi:CubicO group peptidase (beta-lactamase class C family)